MKTFNIKITWINNQKVKQESTIIIEAEDEESVPDKLDYMYDASFDYDIENITELK